MFKIGIIINIAHQPGLPTASNVFHIQITENTAKAIIAIKPMNGIKTPIKSSIGHQCILAILLAISAGPTAGIHAIPAGSVFVFRAIDMYAKEVYTYIAIAIIKNSTKNARINARNPVPSRVAVLADALFPKPASSCKNNILKPPLILVRFFKFKNLIIDNYKIITIKILF
jgi:hypothetical protein